MSEFKDAIAWRGPDRLSFIVYGLWKVGEPDATIDRVVASLKNVIPGSEVSSFVATDDGWPCSVGVFDVECDDWPEALEGVLVSLVDSVCQEGSELSWMMFEGMFNAVEDLFCAAWAAHIFAVRGGCGTGVVDLAVADELRHSAGWAELVLRHREQVLRLFPTLRRLA